MYVCMYISKPLAIFFIIIISGYCTLLKRFLLKFELKGLFYNHMSRDVKTKEEEEVEEEDDDDDEAVNKSLKALCSCKQIFTHVHI